MDTLAVIAIILAVVGIAGGIIPGLPGPPISWVALLCVYFSKAAESCPSATALLLWFLAAVVVTALDFVMPGIIAKKVGGHKAVEVGATIGLFAGIFLTPVGMIAGCFLGAFIAELLVENQPFEAALKAAVGAFGGVILSTGIKVIFSTIILWQTLTYIF